MVCFVVKAYFTAIGFLSFMAVLFSTSTRPFRHSGQNLENVNSAKMLPARILAKILPPQRVEIFLQA